MLFYIFSYKFLVYDEVQRVYLMHWRGVSFSFPAKEPSTVHTKYAHGLGML